MNAPAHTPLLTREQWLNEISELLLAEVLAPVCPIPSDLSIKLSVGFPPSRSSKKVVGVCFPRAASSSGHNEIFVSPIIDDTQIVVETLLHELIHAIDDCASCHTGFFAKVAKKVGFKSPLTQLNPSLELRARLHAYTKIYGDIPHSSMNFEGRKAQKNRNILVFCGCGFKFRTAQTQIDKILENQGQIICPNCLDKMQTGE